MKKSRLHFLISSIVIITLFSPIQGCKKGEEETVRESPESTFPDGRAPYPSEIKEGELAVQAMDLVLAGKKQLEKGNREEALKTFIKASELDFYNENAFFYAAETLLDLDREKDAFMLYTYALTRFPQGIVEHFYKTGEEAEETLTLDKVKELEREVIKHPRDEKILKSYIKAMLAMDRGGVVRSMAEDLVERNPSSTENYLLLLDILFTDKRYAEAVALCREGIKRGASKGVLLATIGSCLHSRQNFDGALDYYLKALKEDPKEATALRNLGEFYLSGKDRNADLDKALTYFRAYIKHHGDDADGAFLAKAAWLEFYHAQNQKNAYALAFKAFLSNPNESYKKIPVSQIAYQSLNTLAEEKIKKYVQKKDTSSLARFLTDKNPFIRLWAMEGMIQLEDRRHLRLLKKMLSDIHEDVRAQAEKAIIAIGGEESIEILEEATRNPSPTVRGASIVGYTFAAPNKAIGLLKEFAESPYPYIRMSAYHSLLKMNTEESLKLYREYLAREWNPRITAMFQSMEVPPTSTEPEADAPGKT